MSIRPSLPSQPIANEWLTSRAGEMAGRTLQQAPPASAAPPAAPASSELRQVFDDFVGQTFYGQMLSAMRKTVDKPAYFHGGRAEEAFQGQLDQALAEQLADATADQFTGPMFELFNLGRR